MQHLPPHRSPLINIEYGGGKGDGAGLLGWVTHWSRWVFFNADPDPYVVLQSELTSVKFVTTGHEQQDAKV